MTEFIGTYGNAISVALIFGMLGLSMWVVMSQGVFSVAAAGLMAIGAYASAWITTKNDLPFAIGAVGGAMAAGIVALPLAKPVMRLRTHYMAIATLGFALIVSTIGVNWTDVTGGAIGFYGVTPMKSIVVQLLTLIALCALAALVYRSHLRRAMYTVGFDEVVAESCGVSVVLFRTAGFVVSGVIAGLAGAFYAHQITIIQPQYFTEQKAFDIIAYSVLGGPGHWAGPVLGAFVLSLLPEFVRWVGDYREIVVGTLLLAIIVLLPGGLVQPRLVRRLWRRARPVRKAAVVHIESPSSAVGHPSRRASTGEQALGVRDLYRHFDAIRAVDGVTLDFPAGRTYGIIGPNGSGKSTFLNLLGGQVRATAGSISLGGVDVSRRPPSARAGIGLSRTFQDPRINVQATIEDNVAVGSHVLRRAGAVRMLAHTPSARAEEREFRRRVHLILDELDLLSVADSYATDLSFGQKRLVEFARAVIAEPRLLLLDEPTSGVNDRLIRVFDEQIRKLRSTGTTIIVVEHNIDFVIGLCDRILVFDAGKVIFDGSPDAAVRDPAVYGAYLGGATSLEPQPAVMA